ncbi:hypothetical protein PoB_004783400 [Plakobranchus ocellatus]|uniref:Uncharacterized protein n=1 Tax=Plakobranchus ocellatus TaxID=259542 RepID=A0AAV4BSG5_9GAST|nr:hypothetical protein PoB_004783400 [Plakobranchus ocellatus]
MEFTKGTRQRLESLKRTYRSLDLRFKELDRSNGKACKYAKTAQDFSSLEKSTQHQQVQNHHQHKHFSYVCDTINSPNVELPTSERLDNVSIEQSLQNHFTSDQSSPTTSNNSCPDCAAGKPGHIRHIGRWRLMDTV